MSRDISSFILHTHSNRAIGQRNGKVIKYRRFHPVSVRNKILRLQYAMCLISEMRFTNMCDEYLVKMLSIVNINVLIPLIEY